MIDRICKNEERLDNITSIMNELEDSLFKFKSIKKELDNLNKYYGSKSWFKDKELYETNKIEKVKAGVLSEDAIWNLNERIDDLLIDMKSIIDNYNKELK